MSTVRGMVARLVDDAAVFPPGDASVVDAVGAHRGHRRGWYADMVGPLLLRSTDVEQLLAVLEPGDDLSIGLIAVDGLVGLAEARNTLLDHDDRATLAQVEIALPHGHDPGAAARALLDQLAFTVPAFVEVPRPTADGGWERALDVLAEDGAESAKLRTGGTTQEAHPDEGELAAFLRACLDRSLSFKLTAGLHHAMRTTTVDGFEQHGVLNVLAAVSTGLGGASAGAMAGLLAERRAEPVVEVVMNADVHAVRAAFRSFGCCGVTDPIDDLVTLGLLAPED